MEYDREIAQARTELAQLEHRVQNLTQQHSGEARKQRTRRLIQRGAIVESLVPGAENMSNEQLKTLLEKALRGPVPLGHGD